MSAAPKKVDTVYVYNKQGEVRYSEWPVGAGSLVVQLASAGIPYNKMESHIRAAFPGWDPVDKFKNETTASRALSKLIKRQENRKPLSEAAAAALKQGKADALNAPGGPKEKTAQGGAAYKEHMSVATEEFKLKNKGKVTTEAERKDYIKETWHTSPLNPKAGDPEAKRKRDLENSSAKKRQAARTSEKKNKKAKLLANDQGEEI